MITATAVQAEPEPRPHRPGACAMAARASGCPAARVRVARCSLWTSVLGHRLQINTPYKGLVGHATASSEARSSR